jgi:hypothetical protein
MLTRLAIGRATEYNCGMPLAKLARIFCVIAFTIIGSGCTNENRNANTSLTDTASAAQANAARTNVEELSLLINVPYETEDIVWKNVSENRVLAVMRFSAEDAGRVVTGSQAHGPAEKVSMAVETWFPDELIAQAEMSGDNALTGLSYPANDFFQQPFNAGRIARVEGGDYFVLEIFSQ